MKPQSDLRSRAGHVRPLAPEDDVDTVSMQPMPGRTAQRPARSGHKSGPYPRGVERGQAEGDAPEASSDAALQAAFLDAEAERRHARSRARRQAFALGITTTCLGGLLGLAFGTQSEKQRTAEVALKGASLLIEDLEHSNQAVVQLSEVASSAAQVLAAGRYPAAEASLLREIELPFGGVNLANRGLGRFKPQLLAPLFDYAALAAQADLQRQKLANLLMIARRPLEQEFENKLQPAFRWAIFLQNEPLGPVANLQRLPQPFPVQAGVGLRADWPAEFELADERGRVQLKRYRGGDPLVAGQSVQLIPVAPETEALVCSNDLAARLGREVTELDRLLNGDASVEPESLSLLERGRALQGALAKIGRPPQVPSPPRVAADTR